MTSAELKLSGTDASASTRASQRPAVLRGRRWVWPAGFVVGGLVLFLAYLRQASTIPVMSDGASNALQAWDMLHGNLLLRGWTLTDLSFYTLDLPEYMLTEAARGLSTSAADLAAALTYTLVVVGAALLAKGRADGREGVVRVLLAAGIMLAPPLGGTSSTLLNDPDHTLTQVPLLLVWLILARGEPSPRTPAANRGEPSPRTPAANRGEPSPRTPAANRGEPSPRTPTANRARARWYVPVAVTVLLAWAAIADPLVSYEGVLPLLAVCAIRLYRQRDRLASHLRDYWYELALAVGAVVSAGIATLALRLIQRAGGFTVTPPDTVFSAIGSINSHLAVTADSILVVFGADFSKQQLGPYAAIPLIHLVGVALAVWAVARALRGFAASELVVQVMAVAMVVLLAAYTFSGNPNTVGGPHEIVGILPIGAVLAGRLLAGQLIRGRHLTALAAVLACYGLVLAHDVVQPANPDSNGQLAALLEQHHLTYGLATYWNASSVTVDSGGRVQVRPVNRNASGQVDAVQRDTVGSWYDPRLHDANFLVLPRPHLSCVQGTPHDWRTAVTAQFGPPTATYQGAGFTVLVWDKNLLKLTAPPSGGAC